MYRFKTEQEFIEEHGKDFRIMTSFEASGHMDYLFGREITEEQYHQDKFRVSNECPCGMCKFCTYWSIEKYMTKESPSPSPSPLPSLMSLLFSIDYPKIELKTAN